jgi:hypothetical protein
MDIPLELPLKFLALLLAAVVASCEARRPDPLSSVPEPSSPLGDGVREAVKVRWPDGTRESFGGRGAGAYHELRRGAGS